jgi:very-short-patch-repair endonuclease
MAKKKTTAEFAEQLLTKHNLKLTSEYLGAHGVVTFECENGHENAASATNVLQRGYKCKECEHGRKIEPRVDWSDTKIKELEELAKTKTTTELAEHFNTTIRAIDSACFNFNIKKPANRLTRARLEATIAPRVLLTQGDITTHDLVEVKCPENHVTVQPVGSLFNNPKCPQCSTVVSSKRKTTEKFAKELFEKQDLTLVGEYTGANNTVLVACSNGHTREVLARHVATRGIKCRECGEITTVKKTTKEFAEEILEKHGLILLSEFTGSANPVTFKCKNNVIHTASKAGQLLYEGHNCRPPDTTKDILLVVLTRQNRSLLTEGKIITTDYVQIECSKGHVAEQLVSNVIYQDNNCPKCSTQQSKLEKHLIEFIKQHYNGWVEERDRTILDNKELDIVLPDLGLAFEINGAYWHTEEHGRDKDYHLNKTLEAKEQGYKLIHIWDYDNLEIVESRILQLLGHSKRIMARKCDLNMVDWPTAKAFLSNSHLQGAGSPTKLNYGLYYENELVAIMTFQKPRFSKEADYEMIRYATKLNTTVVGGASKLLKYFLNTNNNPTILTYANQDWSSGSLYQTLGFKYQHTSEPNYKYVKGSQLLTRYQCQKHKLPKLLGELFDPELTETQNMEANGYQKLWDTGNLVYLLK